MTKNIYIYCSECKGKVMLPHEHTSESGERVRHVETEQFMADMAIAQAQFTKAVEAYRELFFEDPIELVEAEERGIEIGKRSKELELVESLAKEYPSIPPSVLARIVKK